MRRLIDWWLDYRAWCKHQDNEFMDTITCGQWGYWKREPFWPRPVLT